MPLTQRNCDSCDALVEHRRLAQQAELELVVAEDDEHPRVEGGRVAVEPVEHVHHLRAVEGAREKRREEQVAGVHHQQVGVLALELLPQRAQPRDAADGAALDPFDAVDVVDGKDHRGAGRARGRCRRGARGSRRCRPAAAAAGAAGQQNQRGDLRDRDGALAEAANASSAHRDLLTLTFRARANHSAPTPR